MIRAFGILHLSYNMIDMEADSCIHYTREWILNKKESMYQEFIKTDGTAEDLLRYEDEIADLGNKLLKAIDKEKTNELRALGWPEELMECIQDTSINLVIRDFIELSCIRFPNTNSIYNLKKLKEKLNSGLE